MLKSCSKCNIEKSIDAFYNDSKRKDGRTPQCKACMKEYKASNAGKAAQEKYRKSDKGKQTTKRYEQVDSTKEKRKEYEKIKRVRSREKHREFIIEILDAEKRELTKEEMVEKQKQIHKKYNQSEKRKVVTQRYQDNGNRQKNTDQIRQKLSVRYKEHCDRAKKKKFEPLSKEIYEVLIFGKNCFYCQEQISKGAGIDRINSSIGYTVENIRPCCKYCNSMKLVWSENEFFERMIKILKIHNKI